MSLCAVAGFVLANALQSLAPGFAGGWAVIALPLAGAVVGFVWEWKR